MSYVKKLMEEVLSELRRAGEDLARAETVDCLAAKYESAEAYVPEPHIVQQLMDEAEKWFTQLPVRVEWVYDKQPFQTAGQMRRYTQKEGVLLMYAPESILGKAYHKHRAVHDFYGHIEPGIPFGIVGELASFRIHKYMYSSELHSLLFSDVVLNNAYYESNGVFYRVEKYTLLNEEDLLSCPNGKKDPTNV